MKYRVFTNDVGPSRFSAYRDVEAPNDEAALKAAALVCSRLAFRASGGKILVLPHDKRGIWPNGNTGAVKAGAVERYLIAVKR